MRAQRVAIGGVPVATASPCLAAATTAVLAWVENDGTPELPDLIEQAFDTLARPR